MRSSVLKTLNYRLGLNILIWGIDLLNHHCTPRIISTTFRLVLHIAFWMPYHHGPFLMERNISILVLDSLTMTANIDDHAFSIYYICHVLAHSSNQFAFYKASLCALATSQTAISFCINWKLAIPLIQIIDLDAQSQSGNYYHSLSHHVSHSLSINNIVFYT